MSSPKRHQSGSVTEAPFEPEAEASHQVVGGDRWKEVQTDAGASPHVGPENRDQIVVGRPGEQVDEVAMNIMIYEYFFSL